MPYAVKSIKALQTKQELLFKDIPEDTQSMDTMDPCQDTTVGLTDQEMITDVGTLDQQVKSMMTSSEKANPYGQGKARMCKVCRKEGQMRQIMNHIEANHIAGISLPCGLCGQVCKSRNALAQHKSLHHRNQ